ncbi:hypothetical protein Tco_0832249 [Tanacetum coccineum]
MKVKLFLDSGLTVQESLLYTFLRGAEKFKANTRSLLVGRPVLDSMDITWQHKKRLQKRRLLKQMVIQTVKYTSSALAAKLTSALGEQLMLSKKLLQDAASLAIGIMGKFLYCFAIATAKMRGECPKRPREHESESALLYIVPVVIGFLAAHCIRTGEVKHGQLHRGLVDRNECKISASKDYGVGRTWIFRMVGLPISAL